jgi:hypothetical protein
VPGPNPELRPLGRSLIEPVAKDRWQWRVGLDAERKAKLDVATKCRAHNLYRAMLRYGIDHVRRRSEEAQREREARRNAKAASNQPTLCEPVAPWGARVSAAGA